MSSQHCALHTIGFDTNGTDPNQCRPASRRTSIVEQEEQHCPWCYTRKNKLGNLARVYKSRGPPWKQNMAKQGGPLPTYLQVVSLFKVHMTDSSPLLPQIQAFQENYTWILANGHSKLSEDIATFIFCSSLPTSYQDLASQYLISIEDITKYELQKIIAQVIEEESWCKARTNTVASGLWIHKFAQINKYNKHCDKCGRNNHNTVDHWDTPPNRTGKGKAPQRGNKKPKNNNLSRGKDEKGKGKAPQHGQQKQIANVKQIHITDLPNDNFEADYISDCESIDFSWYVLRENSEWLIDSGCNRHVTSHLDDYVSYQQFSRPGNAEIANKQELLILGMGIVIIRHIRTDGKHINIRLDNVLIRPRCFWTLLFNWSGNTEGVLSNQQVRSADYLRMQLVTACNNTCIRGD